MSSLKISKLNKKPVLVLPWPARMWKPQLGMLERSLKRSLPWRAALSISTAGIIWGLATMRTIQGAATPKELWGAVVFSIFFPLMLLVMYPKQRRREVCLPFRLEIGSGGISFKLHQPMYVRWDQISCYALHPSENPHIKRLELWVRRNGEDMPMVFPYDPDEIDERLLRSILSSHLPDTDRTYIHPANLSHITGLCKN